MLRSAAALLVSAAALLGTAGAANSPLTHLPGWDDTPAAWSPGGESLLLTRDYSPPKDTREVRIGLLGGGSLAQLGTPVGAGEWDTEPAWSPDGHDVVFARALDENDYIPDLVLVGADGSGQRNLVEHASEPEWSPDGQWILFTHEPGPSPDLRGVWKIRPDGTDARKLADNAFDGQWSPDGERVAFTHFAARTTVWVMNADGANAHAVTTRGGEEAVGWSPDGTTVLVERDDSIELADAGGGGTRELTAGEGAAWSADGRWIAFSRAAGLYVIHPDGSGLRLLGRDLDRPVWKPDSRTVAASGRGPCLNRGVYLVTVADGAARRVTNDCRITGTSGADTLLGTSERDVIRGLAGNDVIRANPGDRPNVYYGRVDDDWVDAGPGNDRVYAARGTDTVYGGTGDDRLYGGRGADRLYGGPGNDVLDGGRYYDRLFGGPGDDLILARDGFKDRVSCGPGRDTVNADRADVVAGDCERVRRF